MKIVDFCANLFKSKPKEIPQGHKECFNCDGTGEYESFIDCLVCDGQGYLSNKDYYKLLNEHENEDIL